MVVTEDEEPKRSLEREHFYQEVGIKIRAARDKKGFTQDAVASTIGLSRTSFTNIERGRQKLLLHTAYQIATVLGINIGDLLPGPSSALDGIQNKLPTSLTAGQRAFIARAMGNSVIHEPKKTRNDPAHSPTTVAIKRDT